MAKELIDTLFTNKNCKNCERGIWKKINCDESVRHTRIILNEKHEVYFCSAQCGVPGYKTERYKL